MLVMEYIVLSMGNFEIDAKIFFLIWKSDFILFILFFRNLLFIRDISASVEIKSDRYS